MLGPEGYQHRVSVVFIYVGAHLVTFTVVAQQRGSLYCVTVALWGGRLADSAPWDGVLGWDGRRQQGWASLCLTSSLSYLTGTSHFFQASEVHHIA